MVNNDFHIEIFDISAGDTIRYIDIEPIFRYFRYIEASLVTINHRRSCFTSGAVSTGMDNRQRAGNIMSPATSHLHELSLAISPWVGATCSLPAKAGE